MDLVIAVLFCYISPNRIAASYIANWNIDNWLICKLVWIYVIVNSLPPVLYRK